MNIKESLREALILRDWDMIIAIYKSLNELDETTVFGVPIELPSCDSDESKVVEVPQEVKAAPKKRGRPKKKAEAPTEEKVWTYNEEEDAEAKPAVKVKGKISELTFDPKKVEARKSSNEPHKNAFVDSGLSFPKDKEMDRANRHITHEPREPDVFIQIACSSCGKEQSVPQRLAPIRYENGEISSFRCNNCFKGRQ